MMTSKRILAIGLIFLGVTLAWMTLSGAVTLRTDSQDVKLSKEITSSWGPLEVIQPAPQFKPNGASAEAIPPAASDITVHIDNENRRKGMLWYSMFTARFAGKFTTPVLNSQTGGTTGTFFFEIPKGATPIDLAIEVDGQPVERSYEQRISGKIDLVLPVDSEHIVSIRFAVRGQRSWQYIPGQPEPAEPDNYRSSEWGSEYGQPIYAIKSRLAELQNFKMIVTTNFTAIDYPIGALNPNTPAEHDDACDGMAATWSYASLPTRQSIGLVVPTPTNAGPIITRMIFFAPVSLLFFLTVLLTLSILRNIPLHPMHLLFITAGFFAFHILLAYLADQIGLNVSFWICALVSMILVLSYLMRVVSRHRIWFIAGLAQLIYLVGFSYAFFWEGQTGLVVTIGAILTLFVLMQATSKVNWGEVFAKKPASARPRPFTGNMPPAPPTNTIRDIPPLVPEGEDEDNPTEPLDTL